MSKSAVFDSAFNGAAFYSGAMSGSRLPYGSDVLAGGSRSHRRTPLAQVPADPGVVVEESATGYVGAVVGIDKAPGGYGVRLEDRHGKVRVFPLGAGFLIDGTPVILTQPTRAVPLAPARTASGSKALSHTRARVARGCRIWVEGDHDAQLVEKIWGDDLRYEGVVVEALDGLDNLEDRLAQFGPDATNRVGVLADHLIHGTKETAIAKRVHARFGTCVLVIGHPYVDIWQAVVPSRVGLEAWPDVPRTEDWKTGVCKRVGWPHAQPGDTGRAWQFILSRVKTIADVDHTLSGRVEELIDFVTTAGNRVY